MDLAPPEHADNVPLGNLLNIPPFPGGHGIDTVIAARKRVKLSKNPHVTPSTEADIATEEAFKHKVIARYLEGPAANAPLSAAEFQAAFEPGGLFMNAINNANAAALDAAFAPAGVGANAIAAAFAPDGVGTNAIAAGTRASKLFVINQARRSANLTHNAVVNLPYVETPGPNQGETPTLEQLGFAVGHVNLTNALIDGLLVPQINAIHGIYREDSFRPGLNAPNRKQALKTFFFG
jgi:hypothetical protein